MSGYLDDIGLGDTVPRLINHIQGLEAATQALGLSLNYSKCEIIGLSTNSAHIWASSGFNFMIRPIKEACLLGSPLHCDGVDAALSARRVQLEDIVERLKKMSAHEALYLLKSCFAMPRLLYLLRTAPCSLSSVTCDLDTVIRGAVSAITNVRLDSDAWLQGSLPVRWGGIGVRSANDLAPSAFLSSLISVNDWVLRLLPAWAQQPSDPSHDAALARWYALGGVNPPMGAERCSQRSWDDGVCGPRAEGLLARADTVGRARLLASVSPGSGSWLHALPCDNLGLRLGNDELRVAVGLRLGAPLVRAHRCVCGTEVGEDGHHGLACRRSASCRLSLYRGGWKDRHLDGGHQGWGVPQTAAGHCGPEGQRGRRCGDAPTRERLTDFTPSVADETHDFR